MREKPEHADSSNDVGNFCFLAGHDPVFLELAVSAERAFSHDPNTTLIKLRQLGEAMAQDIAARLGIEVEERTSQRDLLYRIDGAFHAKYGDAYRQVAVAKITGQADRPTGSTS